MFYTITILVYIIHETNSQLACQIQCPKGKDEEIMACGFIARSSTYKMFPTQCALERYRKCHDAEVAKTPLHFCIKADSNARKNMYGESCPVFCPNHYRPVCGANRMRAYIYRTFTNGCYLDMLNCRGDDDEFNGYIEVPLEFCQRHHMKNIFKEQVVMTNVHDYRDYNNY